MSIESVYRKIQDHCKKFPVTVVYNTKNSSAVISESDLVMVEKPKQDQTRKFVISITKSRRS